MKKKLTAMFFVLLAGVLTYADPPLTKTVDFSGSTAPAIQVYQANTRTITWTMKNNNTAVNLTGYTPFMWIAASNRASTVVTAACSVVSAAAGTFNAAFSSSSLNTNGSWIYGVGVTSNGNTTARQGGFTIISDPFASASAISLTAQINWSLFTFTNTTNSGPYRFGASWTVTTNADGSASITYPSLVDYASYANQASNLTWIANAQLATNGYNFTSRPQINGTNIPTQAEMDAATNGTVAVAQRANSLTNSYDITNSISSMSAADVTNGATKGATALQVESDTLQTVLNRGATGSNSVSLTSTNVPGAGAGALIVTGGASFGKGFYSARGSYDEAARFVYGSKYLIVEGTDGATAYWGDGTTYGYLSSGAWPIYIPTGGGLINSVDGYAVNGANINTIYRSIFAGTPVTNGANVSVLVNDSNYVTNGGNTSQRLTYLTTNYVHQGELDAATNAVRIAATNEAINAATNLAFAAAKGLTNDFVKAEVTNGLASVAYVDAATNACRIASTNEAINAATNLAQAAINSATNGTVADSLELNGQAAAYYRDINNITNKFGCLMASYTTNDTVESLNIFGPLPYNITVTNAIAVGIGGTYVCDWFFTPATNPIYGTKTLVVTGLTYTVGTGVTNIAQSVVLTNGYYIGSYCTNGAAVTNGTSILQYTY